MGSNSGYAPNHHIESMRAPWAQASEPPILFLHGVGLSADAWRPWYPYFLADFTIVTPDLAGHGTARGAWDETLRLDTFVDGVKSILRTHGHEACHVVGESFGGAVGIAFAARYPEMARTLTLLSTPFEGRRIATLEEWPALVGSNEWPRWMAERRLRPYDDPSLFNWVLQQHETSLPAAVLGIASLLLDLDLSKALATLACPALVISPSESAFLRTDAAQAMHEIMSRSGTPEIAYVKGGPHGIFLTHAEICARITRSFIGRRSRGS